MKLNARVNVLITLRHLAGLKRNAESDISNFCKFLSSVENPAISLCQNYRPFGFEISRLSPDIFTRRALGNSPILNAFCHARASYFSWSTSKRVLIPPNFSVAGALLLLFARDTSRFLSTRDTRNREFPWGISCSFEPRISFGRIHWAFLPEIRQK